MTAPKRRLVVLAFVLLLFEMVSPIAIGRAQTIEPGIALFSFVNLDYDNPGALYIDEFTVYDLDKETIAFTYDFTGSDGGSWHPGAFEELFSYPKGAIQYSIDDNTGRMDIDRREDGKSSAYGKLTPNMDRLQNSEVLMRFRVNEVGYSQYLRVWIQSDQFGSGSSFAANGYGIALHFGRNNLVLQNRKSASTTALGEASVALTNDWHWLKLRAAHGEVSVKLWSDLDKEPEDWTIEHSL